MTTIYSADGQTVTRTFRNPPRGHWVQDTPQLGHYEPADVAHGYFPLIEVARPSPDHARSVMRDGDTFVEVWTFDPEREAARLAAETAATNATTVDQAISAALAELQQIADAPAVPDVPDGTLTAAQVSNILRGLRDETQRNRARLQRVARTLRHTIRLVRGDFDGVD